MEIEKVQLVLNGLGNLTTLFYSFMVLIGFLLFDAGLSHKSVVISIVTQRIAGFFVAIFSFYLTGINLLKIENHSNFFIPLQEYLQVLRQESQILTNLEYKPLQTLLHLILAGISATFIVGACAGRLRLWAYIVFSLFYGLLIYSFSAFWVWNGFLFKMGFVDLAGAGVVFLTGGAAALAGVLICKRRSQDDRSAPLFVGSHILLSSTGFLFAAIGILGLLAASHLTFSTVNDINQVGQIVLNGFFAVGIGFLIGLFITRVWFGKTDLTLGMNAGLAALIALSAEPALALHQAIELAFLAGPLAVLLILILEKWIDDPVGIIGTCLTGSVVGLMAQGCWHKEIFLLIQGLGVAVLFLWSWVMSTIFLKITQNLIGLTHQSGDISLNLADCGFDIE